MYRVTMVARGFNRTNFLFESLMETGAFMSELAKHSEDKVEFEISEVEENGQKGDSPSLFCD